MAVNNIEGAIKKRKIRHFNRSWLNENVFKGWLFILKKIKPIVIYVK